MLGVHLVSFCPLIRISLFSKDPWGPGEETVCRDHTLGSEVLTVAGLHAVSRSFPGTEPGGKCHFLNTKPTRTSYGCSWPNSGPRCSLSSYDLISSFFTTIFSVLSDTEDDRISYNCPSVLFPSHTQQPLNYISATTSNRMTENSLWLKKFLSSVYVCTGEM